MTLPTLALILAQNLAILLAALAALWAISVRRKDASIIDVFWGPACALGPLLAFIRGGGASPRDALLVFLVSLWAARLALYLARRNLGHGEDVRYARMRARHASDADFAKWTLVNVFALQGLIAWFVSLPAQAGQFGGDDRLGFLAILGAIIFAIGFLFETIGDWQLTRFKADPENRGKLMTTGLWAWTRHPNYFGDACLWVGIAIIALESPFGWIGVFSPVVMTFFLVNVSGKALTERLLAKKYPAYEDYKRRTSGFFPSPPRRSPPPSE